MCTFVYVTTSDSSPTAGETPETHAETSAATETADTTAVPHPLGASHPLALAPVAGPASSVDGFVR